jgi:hypothetical protein
MIGVVSDKFAGLGALPTCGRQCLLIIKKKKQSIPRARKQKCQTQPPSCRNSWPLSRYEAPLGRFFGKFTAILDQNCPHTCSSRLTFLTRPCQKCQTGLGDRYHESEKRCFEAVSHHNTPAPLHVGTLTRKVITSLPPAPVPLQHPYERRTSTSLNPFVEHPDIPSGSTPPVQSTDGAGVLWCDGAK